jgi:hypothetical protein
VEVHEEGPLMGIDVEDGCRRDGGQEEERGEKVTHDGTSVEKCPPRSEK